MTSRFGGTTGTETVQPNGGASADEQVSDTTSPSISSAKTGTESSNEFDPSAPIVAGTTPGSTPAVLSQSEGTTAVSEADASLGVTKPMDSEVVTPPIAENPVTPPMTIAEQLLQNPSDAFQIGMTGSLTPLQQQALRTLGDLSKPHEGHTPVVGEATEFQGPAGYYSVLQGWIMTGGQKLEARQVGGRFYFDPDLLDEEAVKQMDKLVEAGAATKQGGNANAN